MLLTCSARNDASCNTSGATPLGSPSTALFTRVGINSEKKHFSFICVCLSVCLSARIRVAPTARIVVKLDIENFYGNMWLNSVFGYNRTLDMCLISVWTEFLTGG